MADTGFVYAASGRNIDKGQVDWANPGNVTGACDGSYASQGIVAQGTGDELNAYNYTMNVPAGQQIDGIQCAMYKLGSVDQIKDYHVYLMDGTSHKGTNQANTSDWWPSDWTWCYNGGASNLWGASWTVAQVNASTFGVIIRAKNWHATQNKSCYVDSIALKVFYSDLSITDHSMIMGM